MKEFKNTAVTGKPVTAVFFFFPVMVAKNKFSCVVGGREWNSKHRD